MSKLAKTGKVGGAIAIKATIKQSIKEGFQQGLKNIDSFKGLVKNVKIYGDNLIQQFDIKLHNMVISGTKKLKSGLNKADNVISEVAQNFRLNIGVEPQLVSGAFKSADSQVVSKITNKLDDFIKASKSHIDDVVGKGDKVGLNKSSIKIDVNIPSVKNGPQEELSEEEKQKLVEEERKREERIKLHNNYLKRKQTENKKNMKKGIRQNENN